MIGRLHRSQTLRRRLNLSLSCTSDLHLACHNIFMAKLFLVENGSSDKCSVSDEHMYVDPFSWDQINKYNETFKTRSNKLHYLVDHYNNDGEHMLHIELTNHSLSLGCLLQIFLETFKRHLINKELYSSCRSGEWLHKYFREELTMKVKW